MKKWIVGTLTSALLMMPGSVLAIDLDRDSESLGTDGLSSKMISESEEGPELDASSLEETVKSVTEPIKDALSNPLSPSEEEEQDTEESEENGSEEKGEEDSSDEEDDTTKLLPEDSPVQVELTPSENGQGGNVKVRVGNESEQISVNLDSDNKTDEDGTFISKDRADVTVKAGEEETNVSLCAELRSDPARLLEAGLSIGDALRQCEETASGDDGSNGDNDNGNDNDGTDDGDGGDDPSKGNDDSGNGEDNEGNDDGAGIGGNGSDKNTGSFSLPKTGSWLDTWLFTATGTLLIMTGLTLYWRGRYGNPFEQGLA